MKKFVGIITVLAALVPFRAFAVHHSISACWGATGLNYHICWAIHVVALLVPIVFGLSVIFFFYGMTKFIAQAGNDKERESGKMFMIWGIVILFIAASIYGFVKLIGNVVGVSQGGVIQPLRIGPP